MVDLKQLLLEQDSNRLFARLYNDLEHVANVIWEGFVNILASTIGIGVTLTFFAVINWQFSLITIAIILITQPVILLRKRTLERVQMSYSKANEGFSGKLQDLLGNYPSLYFANKANLLIKLTSKVSEEQILNEVKLRQANRLTDLLGGAISTGRGLLVECFLLISIFFSFFSSFLTIGFLYSAVNLLRRFNDYFDNLFVSIAKLRSIRQFEEKFTFQPPQSLKRVTPLKDFKTIKIVGVSLSYKGKKVFNDLNLSFKKGKRYAIIGSSGSGKTSLLRLIMGLEGNYQGKILIDEREYRDLSAQLLLGLISYSPVDNFVFDTTIVNNVSLWEEGDVTKAVEDSNLIQDFPDFLSNKETVLGFSEGQKQRVNIARSFFFNRSIIILDESFANLDKTNVNKIKENIVRMKQKTVIVVSHHIDKTDPFFDEIINLRDLPIS